MQLIIVLVALFVALFTGGLVIARVRMTRERRRIDRNRVRSRRNQAYGYAWNLIRRRKRPLMIEHQDKGE